MLDYRRFKEICELFACGQAAQARRLLLELQSRCLGLRDEIDMLKSRIEELEAALDLTSNMRLEQGFYWLVLNGLRQGPFCPRCYDADGVLFRLEKQDARRFCPCCGEVYELAPTNKGAGGAKIFHFDSL